MKKSKKFISLFLALLIVLSSMTICFTAFAEEAQTKSAEAISAAEAAIQDWYDNHRNNLYSTKDEAAKAAARAAYDETAKKVAALSEADRLQLSLAHYSYWLQVVSADTARNLSADPSKSPSTQQKIDVVAKNLSDIEAVTGTLPADYKKVLEGFEPYNVKVGENYPLQKASSINFKDSADAQKVLADFIDNVKGFNERQLNFADYISINSTGGFYFGQTSTSAKYGTTIINILNYLYYEAQDLNTESGTDPKSVYYSTYVARDGKAATGYTYSWKVKDKTTGETYTAEDYVNDFDAYSKAMQSDVIAQAAIAIDKVLDLLETNKEFKGIKEAATLITAAGLKLINNEDVDVAEIKNAVDKYNNLSDNAKKMFDSISSTSNYKVLAVAKNVHTADGLTPEMVYTETSSISIYRLGDCAKQCNDVLYQLLLDDFNKYVSDTDLAKVTDSVVAAAKEKYVALSDAFKKKITDETMAKYTQIVKPASDKDDFAKEVAAFNQTKITRPENSTVAWTTGGIQSAVDELWDLVANTILPLVSKDIDLSKGLDKVLADNVYTNEMVGNILGLYASLSRNETDLGVMGFTLGDIINMLCSPSNIAKMLEEEKFASVAATIKSYNDFKETDDTNKLEALAAHKFQSGDFGFKDGDREGFIDAVLAVLRPITTLLAPGAKALGLVSLNINMFDYIDGEGNYVEGVYANLIPLLEQLGCTDLMTVEEYKANYYSKVSETSATIAADQFLKPVIDSVLKNVLDVVSPDPLNGLIKVLPRLAHIVDTDMVNTSVKAALAQMGMLSGLAANLDLSKAFINKTLAQPIDLSSLIGSELTITLPPIDWAKLADCCTLETVESSSDFNKYFILRNGDTDSAFSTVFYYIYKVVFADEDVYAAVRKLATDNLGSLASIVTKNTDRWAEIGDVAAYGEILDLIGTPTGDEIEKPKPEEPDDPKPPVDPENPTDPDEPSKPNKPSNPGSNNNDKANQTLDDILNNAKNQNTKDTQTKKNSIKAPSIPKTGAEKAADALIAVSALVAIGAAGSLVMLKKKNKED